MHHRRNRIILTAFIWGGIALIASLPGPSLSSSNSFETLAPEPVSPDALMLEGNLGSPAPFSEWKEEYGKAFEKDYRRNEYRAEIHYDLGLYFYEQGAWDLSLKHYQRATEIDSDFSEAFFGIGLLFYTLGDDDNAIKYYLKSLDRNPNDADTRNNLGLIYYRRGQLDLAREQIEHALGIQPIFPDALYNLGLVHYQNDDLRVAAATFERAIEQDPTYLRARFNLGVVYYELGENKQAKDQWDVIVASAPSSQLADQARENLAIMDE